MKTLSEVKPGDQVNVLVKGKFLYKATVSEVDANSIKLENEHYFSKETGENITKPSLIGDAISIEAAE